MPGRPNWQPLADPHRDRKRHAHHQLGLPWPDLVHDRNVEWKLYLRCLDYDQQHVCDQLRGAIAKHADQHRNAHSNSNAVVPGGSVWRHHSIAF